MATAEATFDNILDGFKTLPAQSKILLLVGVPLVLGGLVMLLTWFQVPDYRVLYSNVSDRDGGAIVAALNQQNVPYKVAEGGGAILVPSALVHDVRLRLASQGLPRGSAVGFELMEGQKFGLTQFQEQVNYQRALEGELARSIQTLSSVQSARVHLAIPKPSIFVRQQQKPTASVIINVYPGKSLDRGQIAGITHLVASSLPDLSLSHVSVVDQNGTLLSNAGSTTPGGLDANQLSYLQQVEQSYIQRIVDILTPILGSENVRAQVTTDVDFSQSESTAETFKPNTNPNDAALRSQSLNDAGGGASGLVTQGVPGALSNQPPGTGTAPAGQTNPGAYGSTGMAPSGGKRDMVTNYEVDKTTRFVRTPTGIVRRLSAAVVVNYRQVTAANGKVTSTALSADEMKQINALVREAIGYQQQRGDTLSVENTAFNRPKVEEIPSPPFWQDGGTMATLKDLGKTGFLLGLVAYLIFGVLKPILARIATFKPPPLPVPVDVGFNAIHPPASNDALRGARELAKKDPRVVAGVVKGWVAGE